MKYNKTKVQINYLKKWAIKWSILGSLYGMMSLWFALQRRFGFSLFCFVVAINLWLEAYKEIIRMNQTRRK